MRTSLHRVKHKMAANVKSHDGCTCLDLKGIVSVLKILSNTDRSKTADRSFNARATNSFDDLLIHNLCSLWETLESDENMTHLAALKVYFCGYFEQTSFSIDAVSPTDVAGGSSSQKSDVNRCSFTAPKEKTSSIVRWIFCKVCVHILLMLKGALQAMKKSENSSPAFDLSVGDQQVVTTVIQLVVVLGVCVNLLPGVGTPLDQRSGFGHVLGSGAKSTRCPKCLYDCVMSLVSCLSEPSLSLLILSKNLADILASLMQLGYCEEVCQQEDGIDSLDHLGIKQDKIGTDKELIGINKDTYVDMSARCGQACEESRSQGLKEPQMIDQDHSNDLSMGICEGGILISKAQQEECKRALDNLVGKMYQPLIIRELLFLQGSIGAPKVQRPNESSAVKPGSVGLEQKAVTPKWMKQVCGHLLSKCLTRKNGVQSVLRAVLEGVSGS